MDNLDQLAAELAGELGIDAGEITARQAFLEFSEEDAAILQGLHGSFSVEAFGIAEEFYDHLLRFTPLQKLLPNARDLDRLKRQQARYFKDLLAGSYGEPYVHDRLRVGIVHQRVGLDPKWYIGAYRKYLSELIPGLRLRAGNNEQRFIRSLNAVVKIIMFDMGLALDTYFAADKRALVKTRNNLVESEAQIRAAFETAAAGIALVGLFFALPLWLWLFVSRPFLLHRRGIGGSPGGSIGKRRSGPGRRGFLPPLAVTRGGLG